MSSDHRPTAGPVRGVVAESDGRSSSRAAISVAAGVGVVAGLMGAAFAALVNQARSTVRVIEQAALEAAVDDGVVPPGEFDRSEVVNLPVPRADGVYLADGYLLPDGNLLPDANLPPGGQPDRADRERVADVHSERPLVLAMLGDSTAVGYGTRSAADVPGVLLAKAIAAELGRPVRLRTHGLSGCRSADLPRQLAEALPGAPDLVVIVVGANDIRDKVPPGRSAEFLRDAVAALRAQHIPVVVGTCPDFGVIEPIPQPLRAVLHTWSVLLATLQERAVLTAGGRSVPIGRLVSPDFAHHPELFAGDHFHPSAAGYALAVHALLPAAIEELRLALATDLTDDAEDVVA